MIDLFAEAIAAGHFPADRINPATVIKKPRVKIKRARLTLDVFLRSLEWAKENQRPYLWKAYLLAVTTGQHLSDISETKFKDVRTVDGIEYLAVRQGKTGTKILIPTSLKLEPIGCSIKEVINLCRDRVVSPYLIHHHRRAGRAKPGDALPAKKISESFAEAIKALDIDWGESTPASFHELRSLAEREYKKLGVNTQYLLGHKHQITTDTYADARGHDWIIVSENHS